MLMMPRKVVESKAEADNEPLKVFLS